MKDLRWQLLLGLGLIVLSSCVYLIHYMIFGDARHIFIYLLGDIAFIPLEVLLVTVIIHQLLTAREKNSVKQKMNMIVGAFYSEVGTPLLSSFSRIDPEIGDVREELRFNNEWTKKEFVRVSKMVRSHKFAVNISGANLPAIAELLKQKRDFLLRLLENPNLLEHEKFTSLLWAVFHLTEELLSRKNLHHLTDADAKHVANDIRRAYVLLVEEWLDYLMHLKTNYPYLFSLAVRTNPFDPEAAVEVKQ